MSTTRKFETFVAATVTAALAAAALVGVSATASAAPAPTVISALDFESGSWTPWTQSGTAPGDLSGLSVVSYGDSKVLQVADRTQSYAGIESPKGLFAAGTTYHFSLKARLADGTPDSQNLRFVVKPGYSWVAGSNTAVSAGAWTEVAGDYTVPLDADVANLNVYIGSGSDGAGNFTFLIDDLLITGPPAAEEPPTPPSDDPPTPTVDTILSSDFEGDGWSPWVTRGNESHPTLSLDADAHEGAKALKVTNRADGWHGPALPGTLLASGTYHISGWVKLVSGQTATQLNFGVNQPGAGNEFPWVGSRLDVTDAAWVQIGGDFTVDPAHLPSSLYIESASMTAEFLVDDVLITQDHVTPAPDTGNPSALNTGFEDGLAGWTLRAGSNDDPTTVGVSTAEHHLGAQSVEISNRASQGSGIQHTIDDILVPGASYEVSAWVKFAADAPVDTIWLSATVTSGTSTTYPTLVQFEQTPSNTGWVHLTGSFQAPAFDTANVYFQTRWISSTALGNASTLYFDDIEFSAPDPIQIEELTPIKDTTSFPVGVAIDTRETVGAAKDLTLKHFSQITAENAMKPEAWYNASKVFTPSAEADALLDFAQENDLKVYGHVLVWHSQTPDWFFQNALGEPLTSSAEDQQTLRTRMHDHIFAVASHLADRYGKFGSDTNPLYAFDVVNEVVADSTEYADGLRRSPWYNVLGESYIDLAFQYANEAFNDEYAAPGAEHPVTLFINDYNTEQSGKQKRFHDLVARLLDRGVPVDGVGHQFHVSLSMPVSALEGAIVAFEDLGLRQAVTEFDVTTGTPVTQAKLVDQGYYFRDAFAAFRAHASELFSVTVWGLNDGRSWRNSSGAPLIFNDQLQAKPAYYGIVEGETGDGDGGGEPPLPPRLRTADVFQADVPAATGATDAAEWTHLPLHEISSSASFQLRWEPDHLTAYVEVKDATSNAADGIQLQLGGTTVTLNRDGSGTATGVTAETATGYRAVAELPLDAAEQGDTLQFDVRVLDNGSLAAAWNSPGVTGTLTLLEPVSFLQVVGTSTAPTIDGTVDAVWDAANVVTTSKDVQGTGGAVATVRTLWKDDKLYVLALVADPTVDVSASDPWVQDSVEIYVDGGNVKNGSYRYDDTQIRISAENRQSFGTGDEDYQKNRVESATSIVAGGYVVEASVDLLEYGGLGTFHGLDFQVNDATAGVRTAITNWADPTGAGYQSTARWGVGELVEAPVAPPATPTVTVGDSTIHPGEPFTVTLTGLEPGAHVDLQLDQPGSAFGGGGGIATSRAAKAAYAPVIVGGGTVGQDGTATVTVTIPSGTPSGSYRLSAVVDGQIVSSALITVLAAIAATGLDLSAPLSLALLLLFAGIVLLQRTRRRVRVS